MKKNSAQIMAGVISIPTSASDDDDNLSLDNCNTILDYSCKKKKSSRGDTDHNIVTIISEVKTSKHSYHPIHQLNSKPANANGMAIITNYETELSMAANRIEYRSRNDVLLLDNQAEPHQNPHSQRHINTLYPELLTNVFLFLDTKDKGRVAQVCKYWREVSYEKVIWRGLEAKVHLKSKGNSSIYQCLTRRGIHQIQILSLKKSLRELFVGLPKLTSLKLRGCYNVTDWTLFSTFTTNNGLPVMPVTNDEHYHSGSSSSSGSSRTRLYSPPPFTYHHHQLESLTTLDLSLCKQVSDISLGRIAIRAPNLQVLELGGCCQITDRGLLIVAWGFQKLVKLNLRSCHLVSDTGIGYLCGLVSLEHLHEPKTFDFLTKFGLLQLTSDTSNGDVYSKDLRSSAKTFSVGVNGVKNKNSVIDYDQVKAKRAKRDDNFRHQQCALCRQVVVPPKQHQSAGFVNGFGSSDSSSSTTIQDGRKRKLVCKKYLMNTTLENCQRIMNESNASTPNSSISTILIAGFEKIGPKTQFGTKHLASLVLQDCQKLTDTCLSFISSTARSDADQQHSNTGLPQLQSINLSFCIHITDSGLKSLSKLSNLQDLNLRSCDSITDYGLANLKECGAKLLSLDISFCDKINNVGLNHISLWMSSLRLLSISSCNISDSGLLRIAQSLGKLETLHLGQCSKITDESVKIIAEKCGNIKYIDLYGCNKITREGLEILLKMPNIVSLNLGLWHLR